MSKEVGIKKIAALANVSIGTVDRVLNNRSGVSPKTYERVQNVIDEIGYKKNNIASRLKLAKNSTIKIAVLFPNETYQESHYWHSPLKGIEKGIEELSGMGIEYDLFTFHMGNVESFEKEIEIIFENDFNALITVPFFYKSFKKIHSEKNKKNIPVVFLDTREELENCYFIYQNSFKSGTVSGRLLNQVIQNKGNYIIVSLTNSNVRQRNMVDREAGFRSFLKENAKISESKIYSIKESSNNLSAVKKKFEEISNTKPLGVFVTNSRAYLLPEILKRTKHLDTTIVGYDLNTNNQELLINNKIQYILNQKPDFQAYNAIKGVFKLITERDSSLLNIDIPVEILIKENLM